MINLWFVGWYVRSPLGDLRLIRRFLGLCWAGKMLSIVPTYFVNIAFGIFLGLDFFVIVAFFFPLAGNFWSSVPMDLSSQICCLSGLGCPPTSEDAGPHRALVPDRLPELTQATGGYTCPPEIVDSAGKFSIDGMQMEVDSAGTLTGRFRTQSSAVFKHLGCPASRVPTGDDSGDPPGGVLLFDASSPRLVCA